MKKTVLGLSAIALISTQALAGWASGGGKIHKDSTNPWYLENTEQVRYCIDIDEGYMGVTAERAGVVVGEAIQVWKQAFAEAKDTYYQIGELEPYSQIRVATQEFVQEACSDETDLRMQLGRLTEEQLEAFSQPKEFVGVAFRSDYDKENLRAKGFIYVAPVFGPLQPDHNNMHPEAWSVLENRILRYVITHELGHIFGVGHFPDTLMDEMMPELLVNKMFIDEMSRGEDTFRYLSQYLGLTRIFGTTQFSDREDCMYNGVIGSYEFFGIETVSDRDCSKITFQGESGFEILFKAKADTEYRVVGRGELQGAGWGSTSTVSVYLPREQGVFTKYPSEFDTYTRRLYGESRVTDAHRTGSIEVLAKDKKFPIRFELRPTSSDVIVVEDFKFLEHVINYN